MRSVEVPGPGGPIETWIASPADAPNAALPTIVDVHGGPLGAWAPAPSIEVVLLCARGYRVVLPEHPRLGDVRPTPGSRRSSATGAAWTPPTSMPRWTTRSRLGLADPVAPRRPRPVVRRLHGQLARRDLRALPGGGQRERRDEPGLGVGQLATRASTTTGRRCSAPRWISTGWSACGARARCANVADIRTPLLLLQAEADRRCPPADNEQLFVALRVLGREVEYVLYPEEYHVYQASGRPDRRIDRMTRMLDWFDRYLRA